MKNLLIFSVLSVVSYSQAGIVPASTTLLRQSTSIVHPSAVAYSQPIGQVALSYSAPVAYSHSLAPTVYSQPLLAQSHYASPLFAHGPVLAQQSIFAQYPGLIAQSPVVAQYPFPQAPVIGQIPVQGGTIQNPVQSPVQGGSPTIEAADNPQIPQNPPQQQPQPQPQPQEPPQQSPTNDGVSFDDDTVSVEAS